MFKQRSVGWPQERIDRGKEEILLTASGLLFYFAGFQDRLVPQVTDFRLLLGAPSSFKELFLRWAPLRRLKTRPSSHTFAKIRDNFPVRAKVWTGRVSLSPAVLTFPYLSFKVDGWWKRKHPVRLMVEGLERNGLSEAAFFFLFICNRCFSQKTHSLTFNQPGLYQARASKHLLTCGREIRKE